MLVRYRAVRTDGEWREAQMLNGIGGREAMHRGVFELCFALNAMGFEWQVLGGRDENGDPRDITESVEKDISLVTVHHPDHIPVTLCAGSESLPKTDQLPTRGEIWPVK